MGQRGGGEKGGGGGTGKRGTTTRTKAREQKRRRGGGGKENGRAAAGEGAIRDHGYKSGPSGSRPTAASEARNYYSSAKTKPFAIARKQAKQRAAVDIKGHPAPLVPPPPPVYFSCSTILGQNVLLLIHNAQI